MAWPPGYERNTAFAIRPRFRTLNHHPIGSHTKPWHRPLPLFSFCISSRGTPIYPGVFAMRIGAVTNVLCRPDLKRKTWIGGFLFLGYYFVFLVGLEWTTPGYTPVYGISLPFPML